MPTNPQRTHHLSLLDHRREENIRRDAHGSYTYHNREVRPKFSLGWELEANHSAARVPEGVAMIGDGSVNGDGREYVVLPSLVRSPKYVLGLLKDLVHSPELNTDKSCGFHVHMGIKGAPLPRLRQWAVATEILAQGVEDAAFNAVPEARQDNRYCRRINPTQLGDRFSAYKYDNERRYNWLNTVEMFRPGGIRTVEVRLMGNTHRWKYLLAWSLFCFNLGREGWRLAQSPFMNREESLATLRNLLERIEKEIRPLSKKHEPIPTWVYQGLASFDIHYSAWDRPLAKLADKEATLRGYRPRWYSDNQPTIGNHNNDDNEDYCECGCGDEGRCEYQTHSDGDCDGSPNCEYCQDSQHESGEYCGSRRCSRCIRANRVPAEAPRATPPSDGLRRGSLFTVSGNPTNPRVAAHITNIVVGETEPEFRPIVHPDTLAAMQQEMEAVHSQTIDNAVLYGSGLATAWHDESIFIHPMELEAMHADEMLTPEERVFTETRERHYPPSGGRFVGHCGIGCHTAHSMESICMACSRTWDLHNGHDCENGLRGSFPMEDR